MAYTWLSCSRCPAAEQKADAHCDKSFRKRFGETADAAALKWGDHFLFLNAAQADCVDCVRFWVARGADLSLGTMNNSTWNALEFAKHGKAHRVLGFLQSLETAKSDADASKWGRPAAASSSPSGQPPPPPPPSSTLGHVGTSASI